MFMNCPSGVQPSVILELRTDLVPNPDQLDQQPVCYEDPVPPFSWIYGLREGLEAVIGCSNKLQTIS